MTYAVVTMGGTVVEKDLSEKEARRIAAEKGEKIDNPYYYSVREEVVAERQESAPSFNDLVAKMREKQPKLSDNRLNENIADSKPNWPRWNEVINEGCEGYV